MLGEEPDEEFVESRTGQSNKDKYPVFELPVLNPSLAENPYDTQYIV
jgi:hypothetical protein